MKEKKKEMFFFGFEVLKEKGYYLVKKRKINNFDYN